MHFSDVTPNLIVSDVDASLRFYRDVLGFAMVTAVPDTAPYVFVWLQRDGVSVFLNAKAGVAEDLPALGTRAIGGTNTLFIIIDAETAEAGVDAFHDQIRDRAAIVMPLKTQFYGMREFAVEDPDGYVIFFAQRVSGP